MVFKLPQGHEDSEYVLSFEIGQREGGFYSARTDSSIWIWNSISIWMYLHWMSIRSVSLLEGQLFWKCMLI